MLTQIHAGSIMGIDAIPVTVEVSVSPGNKYCIVGLPDPSIRESFQRIDSALKNSKFHMPRQKIVVNLAPADIRKEGSAFDLSMAAGILASTAQWDFSPYSAYLIMGELSLNGDLKPIKGVLSLAIYARSLALKGFILPISNTIEASIVNHLDIIGIENIAELRDLDQARAKTVYLLASSRKKQQQPIPFPLDFNEVKGQNEAKRALEIASAGGHNILLIGPPGAGKSMLAQRVPSILPKMNFKEALQTTKIHSVKGIGLTQTLNLERPFRAPHHSISDIAMVGGGRELQPGEISMAHHGVLFLDELPEFKRSVLEVLRQPLETHKILISRARFSVEYPAQFMLIGAMNPCPCGNYSHPEKECTCPPGMVSKYLNRVSGPLLDRIDIQIQISPVSFGDIQSKSTMESSLTVQNRVVKAREVQDSRRSLYELQNPPHSNLDSGVSAVYPNSRISKKWIEKICYLDSTSGTLLKKAMEKLKLSARAYDHILKVSRTIADLEGKEKIDSVHIAEAIGFRSLDRSSWG